MQLATLVLSPDLHSASHVLEGKEDLRFIALQFNYILYFFRDYYHDLIVLIFSITINGGCNLQGAMDYYGIGSNLILTSLCSTVVWPNIQTDTHTVALSSISATNIWYRIDCTLRLPARSLLQGCSQVLYCMSVDDDNFVLWTVQFRLYTVQY